MEKQAQGGGMPPQSIAFLRKRKFVLVLPLLVLPFVTMAFLSLGGGKAPHQSPTAATAKGLDIALPEAQFKDHKEKDKMDIYQDAGKDSAGSREGVSQSFIRSMGFDTRVPLHPDSLPLHRNDLATSDVQSEKIEAKLAQINRQISQPPPDAYTGATSDQQFSGNVNRLERMMNTMKSDGSNDPEMKQLSQLLKQISDLQDPGNTADRLRLESLKNKQTAYPVTAAATEDTDQEVMVPNASSGDLQSKKQAAENPAASGTIPAVIHEDQTLVSGAVVKLRLLEAVYVNGRLIPKGSFVYGTCALNNERLVIKVTSIRYLNDILRVSLSAYDLDGLEGLYVPGSISRDAARDGATNAVEGLQFLSADQNLGAQAAGAGIEAAKGLFGRKVKQVKVKVRAGYEVLLKDNNQKDN